MLALRALVRDVAGAAPSRRARDGALVVLVLLAAAEASTDARERRLRCVPYERTSGWS